MSDPRARPLQRIFKEVMLAQFLSVLIQVLVHKSHDLLQEEIGVAVYNMAAVDFDAFYANFLPHLLTTCEGLDDNQKAVLAANFKLEKVRGFASNNQTKREATCRHGSWKV